MSPKTRKILYNFEAKAKVTAVLILMLMATVTTVFFIDTQNVQGATPSQFNHYKQITLESDQVPSTQTNFPVPIHLTNDTDLAADALDSGNDIAFFASDQSTQLNHEIEYFDGDTGELFAWVNVTSLSHSADTNIYMYYGDSDIGSSAENVNGTWHSDFAAVYHMNEDSGHILDSTSNARGGVSVINTPNYGLTGTLGKYIKFNKADDDGFRIPTDFGVATGDTTVEMYCYLDGVAAGDQLFMSFYGEAFLTLQEASEVLQWKHYDGSWNTAEVVNPVVNGSWHYYAGVYTNAGGSTTRYDGAAGGDHADTGNINVKADYNTIGVSADSDKGFGGNITEVAIYSVGKSTDYLLTRFNSFNNCTDGGFFTLGSELGTAASLDFTGSPNNYFTTSGLRGDNYYANETGTYNETAVLTINSGNSTEWIRINVSDIHANITANYINISFDDDNSSWSGNWHTCTSGGESILINESNWDANNWMSGTNPFTVDVDTDGYNEMVEGASIYWRVRVYYEDYIGNETYSKTDMTFDGGYYS